MIKPFVWLAALVVACGAQGADSDDRSTALLSRLIEMLACVKAKHTTFTYVDAVRAPDFQATSHCARHRLI